MGLARFDGETWKEVRPFDSEDRYAVRDLAVGPDGALWASLAGDGDDAQGRLVRRDGETWDSFDWPSWVERVPEGDSPMLIGPEGKVWFREYMMSFDGATWTRYTIPEDDGARNPSVLDLAVAPDGSAWIVAQLGPKAVYVIRPESAVLATE